MTVQGLSTAIALGSHFGSEMSTTSWLRTKVMLPLRVQYPMPMASGKITVKVLAEVGATCKSHLHRHRWLSSASIISGEATPSPTTETIARSEGEGGGASGTLTWRSPCPQCRGYTS